MIRWGLFLLGTLLGATLVAVALEFPEAPALPVLRRIVLVLAAVVFAMGFIAVNWLRGFTPRAAALGAMVLAATVFLIAAAGNHAAAWGVAGIALAVFAGVGVAGVFLTRGLAGRATHLREKHPGGGPS